MKPLETSIKKYVSNRADIELAFLFGSVASGSQHAKSDIDIALLFARNSVPDINEQLNIQDEPPINYK